MLDKILTHLAPRLACKRAQAKLMLRAYEAAEVSRLHSFKIDQSNHNAQVSQASESLRAQARNLEQNHDISSGILDVLVHSIVGSGISIEPQVKNLSRSLVS